MVDAAASELREIIVRRRPRPSLTDYLRMRRFVGARGGVSLAPHTVANGSTSTSPSRSWLKMVAST